MKGKSNIKLDQLAGGAFAEKMEEAFLQIAENIQNPNTEASKAREINVKIKIHPGKNRTLSNMTITVATKLVATEAIDSQLMIGTNMANGQIEIAEFDGSMIGQVKLEEVAPDPDEVDVDPETGEILNRTSIKDIRSITQLRSAIVNKRING